MGRRFGLGKGGGGGPGPRIPLPPKNGGGTKKNREKKSH